MRQGNIVNGLQMSAFVNLNINCINVAYKKKRYLGQNLPIT